MDDHDGVMKVRMRTAVAAVAVACLALGAAVSAPAAAAAPTVPAGPALPAASAPACNPWTGEPLPYSGQLSSVVAFSACDVWAAGGVGKHSLVVHWNGRAWAAIGSGAIPWVATDQPITIGGTSSRDIWMATFDVRQHLLVKHWNGKRFTQVPVPLPTGTTGAALYGISALSRTDAWAVGVYSGHPPLPGGELTLIEHWNGHAWKLVPGANPSQPSGSNFLYSVSARSATDAWAVGYYFDAATDHQPTLIEHWDGHAWTQVTSPSAAFMNELTAVSADSATDAWAVGFANGLPDQALTEHWDGKSWHVVPSLDPGRDGKGRPSAVLTSVSALSPRDVWAAGWYPLKGGGARTLLVHWNGRSWQQVATPLTHKYWSVFNGLSVPSPGDVWAVGETMTTSGIQRTIALHRR
jgi:hypothetical protein